MTVNLFAKASPKNLRCIAIIIAILSSLLMIFVYGVHKMFDTISYIDAYDNIINNEIDSFRTPVYPLLLGFFRNIFGVEHYLFAVIVLQHIVFVFSVMAMWKITERLISNKWLIFIAVFAYNFVINLLGWNCFILTESLSVSAVTLLTLITFNLFERPTVTRFAKLSLLVFSMIMLRPIFVFFIPVYGLIFLINCWRKKLWFKTFALKAIVSLLFVTGSLLGYMSLYQHRFGVFSVSIVNAINTIYIARRDNLLKPEYSPNSDYCKAISDHIASYGPSPSQDDASIFLTGTVYARSPKTIHTTAKNIVNNNKTELAKLIVGRFKIFFFSPFFPCFGNVESPYLSFVPFGLYWIILLMFLFIIVKSRAIMFEYLLIGTLVSLSIIHINAPIEYSRLMLPMMSCTLMMVSIMVERLKKKF